MKKSTYHCQNSKPYPLQSHAPCPAPKWARTSIFQRIFAVQRYFPKDCHFPSGFLLENSNGFSVASSKWHFTFCDFWCNLLPQLLNVCTTRRASLSSVAGLGSKRHTYIYIHTYTHTYTCTCTYTYTYMYIHVHT